MLTENGINEVVTETVICRGREIPVSELKDQSQIKVVIRCKHVERTVKWCRRNTLCRECCKELGIYNTCKPGRNITWGDKISEAKTGKKFSEDHKKALVDARKRKLCKRRGMSEDEFVDFPTRTGQFRLRQAVMSRIGIDLRKMKLEDGDTYFTRVLGYTIEELKDHLEKQFKPGMTWDNYGEWHIDHIRPESWFVYESYEDDGFKQCWALNNLQPLWADENHKKSNLYEGAYRERKVYMLCGQSGVGKTTVADKLSDYYNVVCADKFKRNDLVSVINKTWYEKPILLDISVFISTTFRRLAKNYEVIPVFLIEDVETVRDNIMGRGGRIDNVERRYDRMLSLRDQLNAFSGDSEQVMRYLIDEQEKTT